MTTESPVDWSKPLKVRGDAITKVEVLRVLRSGARVILYSNPQDEWLGQTCEAGRVYDKTASFWDIVNIPQERYTAWVVLVQSISGIPVPRMFLNREAAYRFLEGNKKDIISNLTVIEYMQ
jgi:hypothetical protein